MATLFFEGFNQSTVFNSLDPKYWSTQYSQFPKYGFISVQSFDFEGDPTVDRTSPFGNSFLPPGLTTFPVGGLGNLFTSTDKSYLALYNPNYNDGTIEPPTFIRCSGFAVPSGNKTYFSLKIYGLETNSVLRSEYPYRNKFLSFCSGNTSILDFNIVKITGNFLPQLNNTKETFGIETVFNNTTGVFDLNIDGINNYYINNNKYLNHNILNINGPDETDGYGSSITGKRYIHLEFLIDQSITDSGVLNLKVEGIDAQVINEDTNIAKTNWSNQIVSSGSIYFDNFRIYNRMTHDNIQGNSTNYRSSYDVNNQWILLDDIVLIDNTGNLPTSWLGPSSKIISYKPDYTAGSGLFQWTPNTTVGNIIRKTSDALSSNDGDIGYIEAIDSGNVSALRFTQFTNLTSLPDGIGGIKLYNTARKESLDSQFVNVFATGMNQLSDIIEYDTLILTEFGKDKNDDDTLLDKSIYARQITNSGCLASRDVIKNGDSSFYFPENNSVLSFDHPFFQNNPFTIETWFYTNNFDNDFVLLGGSNKDSSVDTGAYWVFSIRPSCFQFSVAQDSIIVEQILNISNTTVKMSGVKLLFPNGGLNNNTWNHIALCRNSDNSMVCYLNGQANTGHMMIGFEKTYQACESNVFPCPNNPTSYIQYSGSVLNTTFNLSAFNSPFASSFSNIGTNRGYNISQDTTETSGLFLGKCSGYLDNYHITLGKSLYSNSFIAPTSTVLPSDYFINLGPVHSVTQSSYKTFQHFSFHNPVTNKNWKVSEISGMALGVKKL